MPARSAIVANPSTTLRISFGLDLTEECTAIDLGFFVIDKDASAFAGNFVTGFVPCYLGAFGEGGSAAHTLSFAEQPRLDRSNHTF